MRKKGSWIEVRTGRSLPSYGRGQDELSIREINVVVFCETFPWCCTGRGVDIPLVKLDMVGLRMN